MTYPQLAARPVHSRPADAAGYRGAVPDVARRDSVDERSETDRINDLEAWAFRAGRDLAEIKGELKLKSTVAAVDALHQDVREGFGAVNGRLDAIGERLDGQQQLLEEILRRLPAA